MLNFTPPLGYRVNELGMIKHYYRNTHIRVSGFFGFLLVAIGAFASSQVTDLYEVAQGNVALTTQTSIAQKNFVMRGDITNQYVYSPYGVQKNLVRPIHISKRNTYKNLLNQAHRPLNLEENQFGYTGQSTDPSTGLMMLGNFRNYAPGIAQFIQPDTYNSFSNTAINNSYAYVLNNPIEATDPTGHHFALGSFLMTYLGNPSSWQFWASQAVFAVSAAAIGGIAGLVARNFFAKKAVQEVVVQEAAGTVAKKESALVMEDPFPSAPPPSEASSLDRVSPRTPNLSPVPEEAYEPSPAEEVTPNNAGSPPPRKPLGDKAPNTAHRFQGGKQVERCLEYPATRTTKVFDITQAIQKRKNLIKELTFHDARIGASYARELDLMGTKYTSRAQALDGVEKAKGVYSRAWSQSVEGKRAIFQEARAKIDAQDSQMSV